MIVFGCEFRNVDAAFSCIGFKRGALKKVSISSSENKFTSKHSSLFTSCETISPFALSVNLICVGFFPPSNGNKKGTAAVFLFVHASNFLCSVRRDAIAVNCQMESIVFLLVERPLRRRTLT